MVTRNDRGLWFALYRVDERIDDETVFQRVKRNYFRLHPAGVNGTSHGCITFDDLGRYMVLRDALLSQTKFTIPGTDITAYGIITVSGYSADKQCYEE